MKTAVYLFYWDIDIETIQECFAQEDALALVFDPDRILRISQADAKAIEATLTKYGIDQPNGVFYDCLHLADKEVADVASFREGLVIAAERSGEDVIVWEVI